MRKFVITYLDGKEETVDADLMDTGMGGLHYMFLENCTKPGDPVSAWTEKVLLTVPAMNVRNIEERKEQL